MEFQNIDKSKKATFKRLWTKELHSNTASCLKINPLGCLDAFGKEDNLLLPEGILRLEK